MKNGTELVCRHRHSIRSHPRCFLNGIPKDSLKSLERNPSIFVFDIECSYMEVGVFELWDQNISVDQILSQSIILCWSGKFLEDSESISESLTVEEVLARNDTRIVTDLWAILNRADVLIGHNIVGFDLKKLNLRFLVHGLPPIRKPSIDTYLVAKRYFEFPSNSLKGINKYLGIKQKQENEGFNLWKKCMLGIDTALNTMVEYCTIDTEATVELYYKIRAYIKGPPNLSWFYGDALKRCANCGESLLKETGKFIYLSSGKYAEIRCESCGALLRSKTNLFDKEKRQTLLMG